MKIKITAGVSEIERLIETEKQRVGEIPLEERRRRVRELVAQNRRSRFKLIAGSVPPKSA